MSTIAVATPAPIPSRRRLSARLRRGRPVVNIILVLIAIFWTVDALDVRRQRHRPVALERVEWVAGRDDRHRERVARRHPGVDRHERDTVRGVQQLAGA